MGTLGLSSPVRKGQISFTFRGNRTEQCNEEHDADILVMSKIKKFQLVMGKMDIFRNSYVTLRKSSIMLP